MINGDRLVSDHGTQTPAATRTPKAPIKFNTTCQIALCSGPMLVGAFCEIHATLTGPLHTQCCQSSPPV